MSPFIPNRNNRNAVLFQVKQKSEASKLARSNENKNLGLTRLRDNIPGNDQTIGWQQNSDPQPLLQPRETKPQPLQWSAQNEPDSLIDCQLA